MIKNNRWNPEIPRPTLEYGSEHFAEFLKNWIKREYAEEFAEAIQDEAEYSDEELQIDEFGIYQSIRSCWNGDDEDTAETLIKSEGWSYSEAKEFEEKGLYFAIHRKEIELAVEWVKTNGYSLPFPIGSRVKYRQYEGIIQPDNDNYYLPRGEVCVLTDEQAKENQQNKEKGMSGSCGGFIVKWEELTLVSKP